MLNSGIIKKGVGPKNVDQDKNYFDKKGVFTKRVQDRQSTNEVADKQGQENRE